MKTTDELLDQYIDRMAERLSDVELEMFRVAGKRMKKICLMSKEELEEYMYSAELYAEIRADTRKIEKLLEQANKKNIGDITGLFEDISKNAYEEAGKL